MMRLLWRLARYLTGGTFVFSGLVKLNDPKGLAIKLEEYFYVFGGVFEWLVPMSLGLAVGLIVLELLLGFALLLSYYWQKVLWIMFGLLVFFGFLTFYSAYFDKVTDCGCFGDAIPLTPWQSFAKDLVLLALTLFLFWRRKEPSGFFYNWLTDRSLHLIMAGVLVFSLLAAFHVISHLPWIDFRPYKVGADIGALRQPSGKVRYSYLMTKRDGTEEMFDHYPKDSVYTFKEMVIKNPEVLPKLQDYRLWNEEEDATEKSLRGRKLLLIAHSFDNVSVKRFRRLEKVVSALPQGMEAWVVSSVSAEEVLRASQNYAWGGLPVYFGDATLLKTMIRANLGGVLLDEGRIVGKWAGRDLPVRRELWQELL